MDTYGEIKRKLRNIAAGKALIYEGEVKSVSGSTCTVDIGGVELADVRLTALPGETDILITPKVGSHVVLADLEGGTLRNLCVVQYGEVEQIQLNGGQHPICNTDTLKTELQKMSKRIDAIIEALKYSATAAQDGGLTYKRQIATALDAIAQTEDFSDIEDTKITH